MPSPSAKPAFVDPPVRLVIADGFPMVVHGITRMIEGDRKLLVAGQSTTFKAMRSKLQKQSWDIALVDSTLVTENLVPMSHLMAEAPRHARFLFLAPRPGPEEQQRARRLGARGLVCKSTTARELRAAIHRVHRGGLWFDQTSSADVLETTLCAETQTISAASPASRLTPREREVLQLICTGLRNKEMSRRLGISETTVWHHLTSIFSKLRVTDRLSLVAYAYRTGLHTGEAPTPPGRSGGTLSAVLPARGVLSAAAPGAGSRHPLPEVRSTERFPMANEEVCA